MPANPHPHHDIPRRSAPWITFASAGALLLGAPALAGGGGGQDSSWIADAVDGDFFNQFNWFR